MLDVVLPLTDMFHYLFDIEIMLILFYTIFQHLSVSLAHWTLSVHELKVS